MRTFKTLLFTLLLLTATLGFGQTIANGVQPGETQFKEVSVDNFNIHLDIPIVSKGGVGIPLNFGLHYDSNFWASYNSGGMTPGSVFGWSIPSNELIGTLVWDYGCPTYGGTDVQTLWGYQDASGTFHRIPGNHVYLHVGGGLYKTCNTVASYTATLTDGSGWVITVLAGMGGSVTKPNGTVISLSAGTITDTNGNTISKTANGVVTDTFGVQELTFTGASSPPCGTYTYPTSTGTATVTVNCSQHHVRTNFACTGVTDYPDTLNTLVDSIVLGDGTSTYSFVYESQVSGTVTGRIASITYPNGNYTQYAYTGPNYGIGCTLGSAYGLTRTTPEGTWTFSTVVQSPLVVTMISPSPANNKTVYTFLSAGVSHYPTQVQSYQGASTPLQTDVICYNGNQTSCVTAVNLSLPLTQRDVYSMLAGMSTASRSSVLFDAYSNVTSAAQYGFGASTPTFTKTYLNYGKSWNGSTTSPACSTIGSGVNNVPCQVQSLDSASNPISNNYLSYNSHGNLLSSAVWASGAMSGGTYLTTSYVRNANGTASSSTAPNGTVTTLSYASCNGGVLTNSAEGTLSTSFVWDASCNGAVITSTTPPDGNAVSTAYNDPMWRASSTTDAAGNTTLFSYTPTTTESQMTFNGGSSVADSYTMTDPVNLRAYSQMKEGPSSSQWDTVQGSTSWDATGIKTSVLLPCATTQGTGCSTTASTTLRDALGRPLIKTNTAGGTVSTSYPGRDVLQTTGPAPAGEVVKKVQTEYDGLGRLLSSCALSSASGTVLCGQDSGGTGFLTSYTYNNAGKVATISRQTSGQTQSKTFTYDVAGRTLTASYPESGTVQFFYDTAPSTPGVACPGMYNGQLVKTYDANGNTACYTYDSHNRVTSQSYAGPNYDGYNKYFVYDSATVNGVVMANTAGRMAEAYTAPTSGGAKNTDEGFSYTVRGELSDVYELTPHSGGLYYHTSTTFFENGALKTLSGIPSTSSFLFSIDGKGRPYSAIASPSTNMVGSVTYTPANGPLVVSLGLGDSDSYSYDSTTGFIKTFTNTIGATPVSIVGTMTWNQNGTLRQLAVVDGINASLTETCNYGTGTTAGYDEFGRLVSANCGSVWAQTFSYDGFNNLSKSGSSQWLPGYNQANNHYMLAGTTYDSNGNLLTDTFHTYTWNQDNHPLSITDAGITMSYDALGRLVEKKTGSVYNMTVYSPVGKVATMSGTTGQNLVTYDVALPGGVKAVSNGGVKFMHGDWLGSARLVSSRGNRAAYADRAFAPYGEVYGNVGAVDAVNFTGDLQDMVAGTYDTPNRELNPSQGRWISPDPAHSGWNAYAYTSNPLVAVDPSGLDDLSPMITLTLLDPANQGEGHNVSVFMDSDTDLSAAMNRAYSYTPLGYTILTGTVAVSRSSTQDTYDKDGNLLSSTTTTTTAYFQAGGHDAGKYLGTETTTQTSTLLGIGLPETKDSYDLKGTIQAIGAAGVMQAQKTAAAFCTGGCGTAMKFPGAVASDARSHPYKYAFYAVEAAAAFTPLPEGYAAYEGVKAFGEAAFAAWHLAWDLGW